MPSKVQSVLFSKEQFKSKKAAKDWLREHGFQMSKLDETEGHYRFRQLKPREDAQYRTIPFGNEGISAVIMFNKRTGRAPKVTPNEPAQEVEPIVASKARAPRSRATKA